jgi:hypothetical protein
MAAESLNCKRNKNKMRIKEYLKSNPLTGYLILRITSYLLLLKYYKKKDEPADPENKLVIYMADGKKRCGGLTDRLRGIVSLYNFCSDNNMKFKIYFEHPFMLEDYLIPNEYDWRIESNKMIYNKKYSEPVCIINCSMENQKKLINNIRNIHKRQLHVYTNMDYSQEYFSKYFNILFKPAPQVQELYTKHLLYIGNNYVSITYRFQQLLGDFYERLTSALSIEKQEILIKRCLSVISVVKKRHPDIQKILITSDSLKFLERAKIYDYVYIVPGKRIHTDYVVHKDEGNQLGTFLDFFLIANAQRVYFAYSEIMYAGKFAKIAAAVNDKPYDEIMID